MDELVHGGLHPGYAFPLWHAFLAAVSKLAGVDPALVVQHESALLLPLAVVIAYEAGYALFDSAALARGGRRANRARRVRGGSRRHVSAARAPGADGATAARAGRARARVRVRARAAVPLLASAAVASAALALVHPTYAAFLCIPLAGWLVAELLAEPRTAWRIGAALAAVGVPTAAVSLALLPIARDTVSHAPSSVELRRALAHYRDQLVVHGSSYHLAPGVFARSGAVAVAGLVLVPLAVLAWRRRWAQFVLGGSVAVLAVMLVPFLFEHLSDALSLSQSRRAAGFMPFAFAFAGGVSVLSFLLGIFVLPLALAAGVVFQTLWPGTSASGSRTADRQRWCGSRRRRGLVALVVSPLARRLSLDREGWLAGPCGRAVSPPVAVHGFTRWDAVAAVDPRALTPGLVRALRDDVPKRGVVFSDLSTSYRIAAAAPVLIVAAPPEHVADTTQNRPYERRKDVIAFYRSGDLGIPRRYGARWLVIARTEPHPRSRCARYTRTRASRSTASHDESAARDALLPAGGRRRRAASAQVRDAPAVARDRDARPRAGQPALGAHGSRAAAADAGVGAPRALPRAARAAAVGGAAREDGARAHRDTRSTPAAAADRPGRGRDVEPDGDPGGAEDRAHRGHRRRDHDVAARLGAPRRRSRAARDGRALDRRPPRLAARAPGQTLRHRRGPPEGADRPRRRRRRRATRRRDRHRLRRDRRRDAGRSRRRDGS